MDFVDAYRLITLVPPDYAEKLADVVSAMIPAFLGPYDKVAWWSKPGTEQFRPLPGADPEEGQIGRLEKTPSIHVEFTMPKDEALLQKIIHEALIPNHPWEKPVIMVFEHRIARHS